MIKVPQKDACVNESINRNLTEPFSFEKVSNKIAIFMSLPTHEKEYWPPMAPIIHRLDKHSCDEKRKYDKISTACISIRIICYQ